jgi:hypothetical protein
MNICVFTMCLKKDVAQNIVHTCETNAYVSDSALTNVWPLSPGLDTLGNGRVMTTHANL